MRTSCAMMTSSFTLLVEDEGAEVDGTVEARGAAVLVQGCLERSCTILRLGAMSGTEWIYV